MKEYKLIPEYKSVINKVICNKCGKEIITNDNNYDDINLFHEFAVGFNYGSKFDMERWKFDLCEDCVLEIIRQFKFVPEGFLSYGIQPKNPQKSFEIWKKTGKIDKGYTKEELREMGFVL